MTAGLRGSDSDRVQRAIADDEPFPGGTGFAGELEGRLVRDVLGRVPLYVDRTGPVTATDGWAFSPTALEDPVAVPAGTVTPVEDLDAAALEATAVDPDTLEPDAVSSSPFYRHWTLPDPAPVEPDVALEALEEAICDSVACVRESDREVAVAFSGGVDSALVAELLDAPLYVVGFDGCHDVEAAREAAAVMGREADLTVVDLEPADIERAVPGLARAIGRTNAMDVQIALPLFLAAERVGADGFDALAVGQGADELFGGYEKVVHLDHRVEAETTREAVREQIRSLAEQLPRDVLAVEAAGVDPVAPLLDDRVVRAAFRLPDTLLADEEIRKRGLRTVASRHLPESVATRDKKAVQYGSLVARELDRLARQNGYKRRMDDHVSTYVRSLLEPGR
ncbi:asparagine synthase C-terminal domain-containing protein [Natrarchaeobaculum aegyptiacum]|uniref:Asparagine synthase n=1 Tax=Natrarchaeobaculum aegyptiacum TaxID=745377 RepID=A0A2Z2HSM7_9EURY|nr:asparagine synthase-related protein [Natrarchaeobaculum aegyptiacum]ARS88397.1 asparagine synthase [Natrarchaeobaculum aegyptiacum]